jgi:hypothetical protein
MNRYVVARDHRLRRKIDELFSQINRGEPRAGAGPINSSRFIEKRNEDVEATARELLESF